MSACAALAAIPGAGFTLRLPTAVPVLLTRMTVGGAFAWASIISKDAAQLRRKWRGWRERLVDAIKRLRHRVDRLGCREGIRFSSARGLASGGRGSTHRGCLTYAIRLLVRLFSSLLEFPVKMRSLGRKRGRA